MALTAKQLKKRRNVTPAISDAQADEICVRVAAGETCKAVCRDLGVSAATFRLMVVDDRPAGLADRYARAREAQAESWADEIVELADECSRDSVEGKNGEDVPNHEWITRSRLRVDTRKWLMAKLHPKAYGEKIEQTVLGKDGGPIVIKWEQ